MGLAGIAGIPVWPFALVFILLLAAAVLCSVAADTTRDKIEQMDVQLRNSVSTMRELRSLGSSLASQCEDEACRKELKALSEALEFCDPVSSAATSEAESELKAVMQEIQRAIVDSDKESVIPLCRKASAVLAERNRLCKLNK